MRFRSRMGALGLIAALAMVALVSSSVAACTPRATAPEKPTRLAPSEVREYKGKRLDSVDDFRENSIKGPQKVDIETYRLRVGGEVAKPLSLTYDQVIGRRSYEKVVRLNCVEGWSVNILWEGVKLTDLLEQAGYNENAKILICRCKDGYSTSLPLALVRDRDLLLAYKMNGVDLPEERGYPFQVVAEDKWGYKWAKWVTSIEVSNDERFRGYWEQRGYSNDGDLPSAR